MLTAVIFAFTLVTQEFVYRHVYHCVVELYGECRRADLSCAGDVYFWGSMMAACLIASAVRVCPI